MRKRSLLIVQHHLIHLLLYIPRESGFKGRDGLCLPGVDCANKGTRIAWQLPFRFHNRGAPARHLLALNELCLHGPTQFIAPVHDCLTSCLHTLIYFPFTPVVHSKDVHSPLPSPLHPCSTYRHCTCIRTEKQCIAVLSGLVRSDVVLQGFCCWFKWGSPFSKSSWRSIWNGMLTHLAPPLSVRGLWEQAHTPTHTHLCEHTP